MKTSLALLACATLFSRLASGADPDWTQIEDHAVRLLQRYVQVKSVNPPADTREAAHLLQSELEANGVKVQLLPNGAGGKTNLLARLPGKDRSKHPLLLLNHMDVVPVDASRWKQNPFGGLIEGGEIWGRGTLDMKSTGVMQLTALLLLKQLGIVPARDILFLAVSDEETGGREGAGWMIANHWNELNPEYVLDEGGAGSRDVYSPGKVVFGISVAEKQHLWIRVQAQGTSGHGSQPISDNANDLLLRAIEKAKEFSPSNKPNRVVMQMRAELGEFAQNKFMNAIQQNTVALTSLRSGLGDPPKVNVIPSHAEATLDCRLLPDQNADEFLSEIKARINDRRVTVEEIDRKPAVREPSRTDTPLYRDISAALKKQHPESTVLPIIVPYGTDGQKFRARGITVYGLIPMIIDTPTLATMHSDSERIPLDEFRHGLHIYFDILRSDF